MLMSCNDHDFELHENSKSWLEDVAELTMLSFFFLVAFFPDLGQDILFDTFVTGTINFGAVGFLYLAQMANIALPVVLVLLMVGGVIAYEIVRARTRKREQPTTDQRPSADELDMEINGEI